MSQEEAVKLMIGGMIQELPEDQRARTWECVDEMRLLIVKYEYNGALALAYLGAVYAAEVK